MSNSGSAVIDGVDLDALASAVRSCRAVDDLDRGLLGSVATYLPGRRQIAGIRLENDRVTLQVRGKWGVPVDQLVTQIRTAAKPFVGSRTIDLVVSDLSDPAQPQAALPVVPQSEPPLSVLGRDTFDSPPIVGEHPQSR